MKRILSLFLAFVVLLTLCACEGNLGSVNLQNGTTVPENGIIRQATLAQIKSENQIGTFTGESNGFSYVWTIFGSDIESPKDINLAVSVTQESNGDVKIDFSSTEAFGFYSLLTICLKDKWTAQSATAYHDGQPVASVSLTGSTETVLNLSTNGALGSIMVRPDAPLSEGEVVAPTGGEKDQYMTDPVPEGKPTPVEPENQDVDTNKTLTCTFTIDCATILNNLSMLEPAKLELVPSDGIILETTTVTFYEGESVYDVLKRLCQEKGIHMESEWTPIYNSAYVEGIHNLYEFDCGALSGWMYQVNGWYPNYGSSRYQLKDGDVVQWRYTCDLGNDIGGGYAVGG